MGHSDSLNEQCVENNTISDMNKTRVERSSYNHDSHNDESNLNVKISYAEVVKGKMRRRSYA